MKTVLLKRFIKDERVTMGALKIEGVDHDTIFTLELPWKENKKSQSCVPPGEYKVVPYSSEKYTDVYEVTHVNGRSFILIHVGNYLKDTRGYILPGMGLGNTDEPMVTLSRKAMGLLKGSLDYKPFILKIF